MMAQQALSLFETATTPDPKVVAIGPRKRAGAHPAPTAADDTELLGHLIWTTISDAVRLTPDTLAAALAASDLAEDALAPSTPSNTSALSRAAESAQATRQLITHDRHKNRLEHDRYANVIFRTATRGTKQIVTEILDAESNRLLYQPFASVELKKGRLLVTHLNDYATLAVEDAVETDLRKHYELEKGKHDGENVRRVLTRVLRRASAITLRASGGMYFIPRENAAEKTRILTFVDEVKTRATDAPGRLARPSAAMSVPLVDTVEYREILTDSLDEHVEREAHSLVREMSALLKSDTTITRKRQKGFIDRVKKLTTDVETYEGLLAIRATDARSRLDIAMKEAHQLLAAPPSPDPTTPHLVP